MKYSNFYNARYVKQFSVEVLLFQIYSQRYENLHKNSRSSNKIIFSPNEFSKLQKGFTSFYCFQGISLYFSIFVLIILTFFRNQNFNFTILLAVELHLFELNFSQYQLQQYEFLLVEFTYLNLNFYYIDESLVQWRISELLLREFQLCACMCNDSPNSEIKY